MTGLLTRLPLVQPQFASEFCLLHVCCLYFCPVRVMAASTSLCTTSVLSWISATRISAHPSVHRPTRRGSTCWRRRYRKLSTSVCSAWWHSKILYVLRPVIREGSYQGETKCIPTTSENSVSLRIPPLLIVEIYRKWSWMSWEGRYKVDRSPVSRHSM